MLRRSNRAVLVAPLRLHLRLLIKRAVTAFINELVERRLRRWLVAHCPLNDCNPGKRKHFGGFATVGSAGVLEAA